MGGKEGGARRILTVEDEGDLRTIITRVLASAGYETMEAENGKVGLEVIFRSPPDLIITDVMMPEIDGVQMVKQRHQKGDVSAQLDHGAPPLQEPEVGEGDLMPIRP